MTTAYVVQIRTDKGERYLGASGKISQVPKFFLSKPAVRDYITRPKRRWDCYNVATMSEQTRIVVINDMEKGLKDSRASVYFYGEFLAQEPLKGKSTNGIKNNPKAVYKLQLADKTFVSFGSPKPKHGKVWNRAGDLRSHITQHIGHYHYNYMNTKYRGAEVVEIEYDTDGIMPISVKRYPIIDFYVASPDCAKRFQKAAASTLYTPKEAA